MFVSPTLLAVVVQLLERLDRALAAARESFPKWRAIPPHERGKILHKAADLLTERTERIARGIDAVFAVSAVAGSSWATTVRGTHSAHMGSGNYTIMFDPDYMELLGVLTPTVARGGHAKNVVPDSFQINVNYRFAPGKDLEDVKRLFEELLDGSATYEVVDFAPSGPVNLDNPLLQELIETGLEVRPKQAWTDVARFSERGVAAANFGPGLPSQAHKQNEYAELPLLEECYTHLVSFFSISARSG